MHTHTCTHTHRGKHFKLYICLDPVDGMATKIKTEPIDVSITGEPIGIATSHNGIFIAIVEM